MKVEEPNSHRHCMVIEDWPQADHLMWLRMTQKAAILEDPGVGSTWRPSTELGRRRYYGRWLSYLTHLEPNALGIVPLARITEDRVQRYFIALQEDGLSYRTIHGYLIILLLVLKNEKGLTHNQWIKKYVTHVQALASEESCTGRQIAPPTEVLEKAFAYMRECHEKPCHLLLDIHVRFRDGLMIALQTARALRPSNLAMIEIGRHLIEGPGGHHMVFKGHEVKTNEPYNYPFPKFLESFLQTYLSVHRPALLQGRRSAGLWISNEGRMMTQNSLSKRFKVMTQRLLGYQVSPHAFRHSAATYVATEHPNILSTTPAILHHSSNKTAERYYTMANGTAASRRYQDVLFSKNRSAR